MVLDGEILGVSDEGPEAFQATMSSFGRRTGPPGRATLGVWFFDCLHLDGEDLLDRPLLEPLRQRVALRFARVRRYREDKDPADADTIDAVRDLLHGVTTATPGVHADAGDPAPPPTR